MSNVQLKLMYCMVLWKKIEDNFTIAQLLVNLSFFAITSLSYVLEAF